MTHQFKIGDRVRLKADQFDYAARNEISGEQTIKAINGAIAIFENGQSAFLFRLEPAPPLIDPAKTYTTRDGRAVLRILATDLPGKYPVAAATEGSDPEHCPVEVGNYTADGHFMDEGESDDDLIEVKPAHTRWIVVTTPGYGFDTKEEAQTVARDCNYFAVVPITFKRGDGCEALRTL